MTRTEAIATITSTLASFDDERVQAVADIVAEMDQPAMQVVRALSDREAALLAQSKVDFAAGRTVTMDDVRARTDALIARFEAEQAKRE